MKLELDEQEKAKIASEIAQEVLKALTPALLNRDSSQNKVFTVDTLAEYLQTSPKFVYNHLHELPHFRAGGIYRFRKKAIDQLFEEIPSR